MNPTGITFSIGWLKIVTDDHILSFPVVYTTSYAWMILLSHSLTLAQCIHISISNTCTNIVDPSIYWYIYCNVLPAGDEAILKKDLPPNHLIYPRGCHSSYTADGIAACSMTDY